MDTSQNPTPETSPFKTSRLPAGSIMTLPNGVTIPHPHAEANAPGAGDTRLEGTDAVTESFEDAARAQQASQRSVR